MKRRVKGFSERAERSRAGRYMDQQGTLHPIFLCLTTSISNPEVFFYPRIKRRHAT